jgi:uncharacterized membrane protein YqjE
MGKINTFKYIEKLSEHHTIIFTLLVATAIILFWKGIMGTSEIILQTIMPDNHLLQNITAIIIALIILGSTHTTFKSLT